jgi:hypothetical protein
MQLEHVASGAALAQYEFAHSGTHTLVEHIVARKIAEASFSPWVFSLQHAM